MKKVNLFIVGAMKSGTTSLHNYLNIHPEIFMCEPKEPGYFAEEIAWNKGLEWYMSLFKDATEQHKYIGESSTYYTKLPDHQGVVEKIYDHNPDAKFIYVMRNPFTRIVSHYWHEYRQHYAGGVQNNILQECKSKDNYIHYSDYAMQLRPYINKFGKDRIYLLTFEGLINNPIHETKKIFEWLGLEMDAELVWSDTDNKYNANPKVIYGIKKKMKFMNAIRYSKSWDSLSKLFPKSLRSFMSNSVTTKTSVEEQQRETELLRQEIKPEIDRIIDNISNLTGTDYAKVWNNSK
ncbi:MAG: sulfotransferase [Candidatus Thiodiazotropha sp.]